MQEARTLRRPLAIPAVLVAGALGAAATANAATTINVTAGQPEELEYTLSKRSAAAGSVTFRVTNRGTLKHDFKIAGKKTKLIAKQRTAALTVTLRRGRYRYLCTVPGHADGGMRGTLTVR
jgi:uncharacterized cupredoxin-like copper-binding protein